MKSRIFFPILLIFFTSIGFSQVLKPVKWSFSAVKTTDSTANLYLKATIEKNWHLYSQYIPDGPSRPDPTTFTFHKSENYMLIGKVYEPKAIEEYDPNFEMKIKYFANAVTFVQKIKILSKKPFIIRDTLSFMTCDNKQCLPPEEVPFSFNLASFSSWSKILGWEFTVTLFSFGWESLSLTNSTNFLEEVFSTLSIVAMFPEV